MDSMAGATFNAIAHLTGSGIYRYQTGRVQHDGAITGTAWRQCANGSEIKAGGFRVESNGTITRFPGLNAARQRLAEQMATKGACNVASFQSSDIPPNARKVRHKHSSAIAYFWQTGASWQVVISVMRHDMLWATVGTMSDLEQFITSRFEAAKASEAEVEIAAIEAQIANAPTFNPADTDGLADEPDSDPDDTDPDGAAPATGRQSDPRTMAADTPLNTVLNDPMGASVHVVHVHTERAMDAISASATISHAKASRTIRYDDELSEAENHMAVASMLAASYGAHAVGEIGNLTFGLPIIRKRHSVTLKVKSPPRNRSSLGARCPVGADEQARLWRQWKGEQIGRALDDDEIPAWAMPCKRADLFLVALQSGKAPADCLNFGQGYGSEAEAAMPVEQWDAERAHQTLARLAKDRRYDSEAREWDMEREVEAGEMRDQYGQPDDGRDMVLALIAEREAMIAPVPPHMSEAMRRVYGPKWVMARRTPGNLRRYDGYAFVTQRQYADVQRVWQALQANTDMPLEQAA